MMLLDKIKPYFSLVKFSHTIFALPFALVGFVLGLYDLNFEVTQWGLTLLYILLCMVFARNAAMSFNRYADRRIDTENPRTANREIPKGIINARSALIFVVVNAGLFIGTTYFINPLCFYLSPLALLVVLGYSYTKRFTWLCHFILGIGLAIAPTGAYIAVTGQFAPAPLLLSAAVWLWVTGFDILYALQDESFDKKNALYSIPSYLGIKKSLTFSSFTHLISAVFLFFFGYFLSAGFFFWLGFSIFCGLLLFQHLLVKPHDLSKVNAAFQNTNGVASVCFSVCCIVDLLIQ